MRIPWVLVFSTYIWFPLHEDDLADDECNFVGAVEVVVVVAKASVVVVGCNNDVDAAGMASDNRVGGCHNRGQR